MVEILGGNVMRRQKLLPWAGLALGLIGLIDPMRVPGAPPPAEERLPAERDESVVPATYSHRGGKAAGQDVCEPPSSKPVGGLWEGFCDRLHFSLAYHTQEYRRRNAMQWEASQAHWAMQTNLYRFRNYAQQEAAHGHVVYPVCPPYCAPGWGYYQTCWRPFPEGCDRCPRFVSEVAAPLAPAGIDNGFVPPPAGWPAAPIQPPPAAPAEPPPAAPPELPVEGLQTSANELVGPSSPLEPDEQILPASRLLPDPVSDAEQP